MSTPFTILFADANNLSAKQYNAHTKTPVIFKLYIFMMTNIGRDNTIQIIQSDLAKKFGVNRSQISRSLKSLETLGFVNNLPKRSWYRLSPEVAMKQNVKNKPDMVAQYKEEAKKLREELAKTKKQAEENEKQHMKFYKKIDEANQRMLEGQKQMIEMLQEILNNQDSPESLKTIARTKLQLISNN